MRVYQGDALMPMTDPRPSIAELQRLTRANTIEAQRAIRVALPVLLEIAAAALAWQMSSQTKSREARTRLLAALGKVRP